MLLKSQNNGYFMGRWYWWVNRVPVMFSYLICVLVTWMYSVCEKSSSHILILMICTFFLVLCFSKMLIYVFNFQQSFKAKVLRSITLPPLRQPECVFHWTQHSSHLAWHLLHFCIPCGMQYVKQPRCWKNKKPWQWEIEFKMSRLGRER